MNAVTKVQTAHKNVYVALCAAQMEMGPLVKGSVNPAFKSKYADLADLVQAVREPLANNGLAYFHTMVADPASAMRTVLVHGDSDTRIECDVPLIVSKNDMQGMKSATTYAKRIGLESVTGVAPEDDDGNAAAKAAPAVDERAAFESGVSHAIQSIGREKDLESLGAMWADLYRHNRRIADDPRVIKAKDDRKTALTPASQPADLGGDEIPY